MKARACVMAFCLGLMALAPSGLVAGETPPPAEATEWLQEAVARARNGADREIVLPAGRFAVSGPLSLPSGVTLRGAGRGATLLVAPSGATFALLEVNGVRDVTIADLSLVEEGGAGRASRGCGLAIDAGSRFILVENVAVEGFLRGISIGRQEKGESGNIVLRGCRAEKSRTFGFDLNECREVLLDSCYAFEHWLDGIKLRSRARDVTIRGGESSRNGTSRAEKPSSNGNGVDAYAGGEALLVDSLVMEGNAGSGLYMKTGDLNKPGGNHGRVGDVMVSHVRSRRNIGSGLDINRSKGDQTDAPLLANVVVTGGLFEENTASGVYVRGRNMALVGVIARANAEHGISLSRAWDLHLDALISVGNGAESSLNGAALFIGSATRVGIHGGLFDEQEEPLAQTGPLPKRSVSQARGATEIIQSP